MKQKTISLLLIVLLGIASIAQTAESVKNIQVSEIGGSTDEVCFGHGWDNLAVRSWQNNTGRTLRIYKTYVSMGMDYPATADFHTMVWITPSMEPLVPIVMFDHYAPTNAPTTFQYPVSGGYIELQPGEGIETWVYCTPFKSKGAANYQSWHFFVTVAVEVNRY